jgi:hypothetical protein
MVSQAGLTYLLCRFHFGDMHRDAALQTVRLFARDGLMNHAAP